VWVPSTDQPSGRWEVVLCGPMPRLDPIPSIPSYTVTPHVADMVSIFDLYIFFAPILTYLATGLAALSMARSNLLSSRASQVYLCVSAVGILVMIFRGVVYPGDPRTRTLRSAGSTCRNPRGAGVTVPETAFSYTSPSQNCSIRNSTICSAAHSAPAGEK
jgi:hypothetical protein